MADFDIPNWAVDEVTYKKDEFHNEEMLLVKLVKQEKKEAEWLRKNNGILYWSECSSCGNRKYLGDPTPYCPNCGCKMIFPEETPTDEDQEFYD